jgi:hypothetical protein
MRTEPKMMFAGFVLAAVGLPVLGQATAKPTHARVNPGQTPFTAEFKVSSVRTLANGTTITQESTEVEAVDSQGRRMTATTASQLGGEERTSITVFDPAAGTRTSWSTPGQQAKVAPTHPSASVPCAPAGTVQNPPAALRPTSTSEDLGVETIDGVEAHGHRVTITTPAGMIGNSEPLVSTREIWTATTIKPVTLVVRLINDDPDSGKMTKEMTNLSLSDPDQSVFQPPRGYEVVTGNAPPAPCTATPRTAAPAEPPQ